MPGDRRRTVAAVVIPGMAPLDLFGPIQAFNVAYGLAGNGEPDPEQPLYDVVSIGARRGLVPTGGRDNGPAVHVDHTFYDPRSYDILLVPGGMGTRALVRDRAFLAGLAHAARRAPIVACVCTGAALLAVAGLLDGLRATTNKLAWGWVTSLGSQARWECCPRWIAEIDDGTLEGVITSGGVSAGTDMTLALIEKLNGPEVAANATEIMEWDRRTTPDPDPWGQRLCPPGLCPPS